MQVRDWQLKLEKASTEKKRDIEGESGSKKSNPPRWKPIHYMACITFRLAKSFFFCHTNILGRLINWLDFSLICLQTIIYDLIKSIFPLFTRVLFLLLFLVVFSRVSKACDTALRSTRVLLLWLLRKYSPACVLFCVLVWSPNSIENTRLEDVDSLLNVYFFRHAQRLSLLTLRVPNGPCKFTWPVPSLIHILERDKHSSMSWRETSTRQWWFSARVLRGVWQGCVCVCVCEGLRRRGSPDHSTSVFTNDREISTLLVSASESRISVWSRFDRLSKLT